ncbi:MAG: AraC family transcriptional regulator [Bacteroidota bacterium]
MEKPELWSSMSFLRNVVLAAERKGGDLTEICRDIGITKAQLETPDAMIDMQQSIRVWDTCIRITGDPFLGLHLGETTSPALAGMVGYLMESSPDLLTAFQTATQFYRLLTNMTDIRVEIKDQEFRYYIEPIELWYQYSPEAARQIVEHMVSAFVHMVKLLSGRALFPLRLSLRFNRPGDLSAYQRVLRCEPAFSQSQNCLVYRLRDIQLPTIGHNPALNRLLKSLLEQEMQKARQRQSFSSEVRYMILREYNTQLPQLQFIADKMNLSTRSLQRKLQADSTSFQQVLDSVKQELAMNMLQDKNLTVNEIAYRLGYAEPSVFRRAFKKWTGFSPRKIGSEPTNPENRALILKGLPTRKDFDEYVQDFESNNADRKLPGRGE